MYRIHCEGIRPRVVYRILTLIALLQGLHFVIFQYSRESKGNPVWLLPVVLLWKGLNSDKKFLHHSGFCTWNRNFGFCKWVSCRSQKIKGQEKKEQPNKHTSKQQKYWEFNFFPIKKGVCPSG